MERDHPTTTVQATLEALHGGLTVFRDSLRVARDGLPASEARIALECALLDHVEPLLAILREEGRRASLAMGEDFVIRRAEAEDAERIEALARALEVPSGPPLTWGLDPQNLGRGEVVLVAVDPQQELAGFFRATSGGDACITHLAVLPAFQDRGLAVRFLLLGVAELAREGARRIGGFVDAAGPLFPVLAAIGASASGKPVWMEREITSQDRQAFAAGRFAVAGKGSVEELCRALGDVPGLIELFAEPGGTP